MARLALGASRVRFVRLGEPEPSDWGDFDYKSPFRRYWRTPLADLTDEQVREIVVSEDSLVHIFKHPRRELMCAGRGPSRMAFIAEQWQRNEFTDEWIAPCSWCFIQTGSWCSGVPLRRDSSVGWTCKAALCHDCDQLLGVCLDCSRWQGVVQDVPAPPFGGSEELPLGSIRFLSSMEPTELTLASLRTGRLPRQEEWPTVLHLMWHAIKVSRASEGREPPPGGPFGDWGVPAQELLRAVLAELMREHELLQQRARERGLLRPPDVDNASTAAGDGDLVSGSDRDDASSCSPR